MNRLLALSVISFCSGCQMQGLPKNECPVSLSPIEVVQPEFPSRTGSQFRGAITAAVVIESDGTVSHTEISSIAVEQLDRRKFSDSGYAAAALDAVSKWRFQKPLRRCKKEIRLELSLSE